MQRDAAYLRDILEAARLALAYLQKVDREAFDRDTQLQDAVLRRLEIIGEAARRVSADTRRAHPEIPWRHSAMRIAYRPYQRVHNVGFRVVAPATEMVQAAKGANDQ